MLQKVKLKETPNNVRLKDKFIVKCTNNLWELNKELIGNVQKIYGKCYEFVHLNLVTLVYFQLFLPE